MNALALRMLLGDRAKFLGIVFGIGFAAFLITQQVSIFVGLMARTFGFLTDASLPQVWVMDPKVQFIDDLKPLQDTQLYRVRGVEGVAWAMPLYKGLLRARLANGAFQTCNVIGIDDSTLIGGPPEMLHGRIEDLRRADGVVVDDVGASGKLARPAPVDPSTGKPIGKPTPLRVGDFLELNDHRAVVVGICRVSRTFQSQPVVYTTYTRAVTFAPRERKLLSFVVASVSPGRDVESVAARIRAQTGLAAYTSGEFKRMTVLYFMRYTGIPLNFGIAVVLGFLVGTAIAGQTFYNFTLDNLRQFGALKAMGTGNLRLLRMILLQALLVGFIGYGLGVGSASLFAFVPLGELAFMLLPQTLAITGAAIVLICLAASLLSIQKVMRLEPAIVFKG
ncbi:MAG: FtsX-like permease family protein [Phycisphaerales bacterium]|nr:FtsX-like permease family protein [Phycisphaerales bacterium]